MSCTNAIGATNTSFQQSPESNWLRWDPKTRQVSDLNKNELGVALCADESKDSHLISITCQNAVTGKTEERKFTVKVHWQEDSAVAEFHRYVVGPFAFIKRFLNLFDRWHGLSSELSKQTTEFFRECKAEHQEYLAKYEDEQAEAQTLQNELIAENLRRLRLAVPEKFNFVTTSSGTVVSRSSISSQSESDATRSLPSPKTVNRSLNSSLPQPSNTEKNNDLKKKTHRREEPFVILDMMNLTSKSSAEDVENSNDDNSWEHLYISRSVLVEA
ncbi:MAG: hypothetical protein ACPGUD_02595 [Parashewanella sp.]